MKNSSAPTQHLAPISPNKTATRWFSWLIDPLPQRFYLPATGLWILGLDWLLFPEEAASLALATPIAAVIGFVAGSVGAYYFQRRYALNNRPIALLKALLAGLIVGAPFPIVGTVVGGWVLASSGLAELRQRFFQQRR